MAITDLTGTKWVLNEGLNSTNINVNINFISNGNNYSNLRRTNAVPMVDEDSLWYGDVVGVYSFGTWSSPSYRSIEITGGTDATNATLIAWLEANATQVPVEDLNGTEWEFNDTLDLSTFPALGQNKLSINFSSNNNQYTGLRRGITPPPNTVRTLAFVDGAASYVFYIQNSGWADNSYKTISITSGTDTTNPDLIAWLSQNATLQADTPSLKQIRLFIKRNNSLIPVSLFSVEDNSAVIPSTSVSDLTDTTWLLNENITSFPISDYEFELNFTSNNQSFNGLSLAGGIIGIEYINYPVSGVTVYTNRSTNLRAIGGPGDDEAGETSDYHWIDEAWRTVHFIDGNAITNATLINWLKNNAQLIGGSAELKPRNTTLKI